jgi:hypothetical protein
MRCGCSKWGVGVGVRRVSSSGSSTSNSGWLRAFAVDVLEGGEDVGRVEACVVRAEAAGLFVGGSASFCWVVHTCIHKYACRGAYLGAGKGVEAIVDIDPQLPALLCCGVVMLVASARFRRSQQMHKQSQINAHQGVSPHHTKAPQERKQQTNTHN